MRNYDDFFLAFRTMRNLFELYAWVSKVFRCVIYTFEVMFRARNCRYYS